MLTIDKSNTGDETFCEKSKSWGLGVCSCVTKFSPSPVFGPILFFIRGKRHSELLSIYQAKWVTDPNSWPNKRTEIKGAFTLNEIQPDIFTLKICPLVSLALCQWWRAQWVCHPFCPLFIDTMLNNNRLNIGDGLNFVTCERSFRMQCNIISVGILGKISG